MRIASEALCASNLVFAVLLVFLSGCVQAAKHYDGNWNCPLSVEDYREMDLPEPLLSNRLGRDYNKVVLGVVDEGQGDNRAPSYRHCTQADTESAWSFWYLSALWFGGLIFGWRFLTTDRIKYSLWAFSVPTFLNLTMIIWLVQWFW